MSDRRAVFFAIAAVMCFLLVPVADAEFRWVAWGLGAVYAVLCVASALDHRSRQRD
jgi:hypothetical protein